MQNSKGSKKMSESFFSQIVGSLDSNRKCRVAVPIANDEACAFALTKGIKSGILEAVLIGDAEKIKEIYGSAALGNGVKIINESDPKKACALAVKEVKEKRCDILMKGMVPTAVILKAVLNKTDGIKKNEILSHITFFELPNNPGLKVLTDAAMCIAPDKDTLIKEIENAKEAFNVFYSRPPKVALLAANEKVSEKMPSTILDKDVAEALANRKDMIVEGPISFDLSISANAAQIKKYEGKIKGDADIFVVPRIDVGNAFYKGLQYYVKASMGGMVYGAACPVVLTSRADDNNTKFNSLLLGILMWQKNTAQKVAEANA